MSIEEYNEILDQLFKERWEEEAKEDPDTNIIQYLQNQINDLLAEMPA